MVDGAQEPPAPPTSQSPAPAHHPAPPPETSLERLRGVRVLSQGYGDITKLREMAAKWNNTAAKLKHKAAQFITRMEKARHRATVYREKQNTYLAKVPLVEGTMADLEKELQAGAHPGGQGIRPQDQSRIHVKIRRLQERILNLQRKARIYETKAAHQMAIASQRKITADTYMEQANAAETEAANLTSRADRLQRASEPEMPPPPVSRPPGTGSA